MKKWQKVRRMTPHQKGEIIERVSESGLIRQDGEYKFLREDGTISNFVLRRCPHCGYVDVWHINVVPRSVKCNECGEFSILHEH